MNKSTDGLRFNQWDRAALGRYASARVRHRNADQTVGNPDARTRVGRSDWELLSLS